MNQINGNYPTELRELAEIHVLPTPVYQALYVAAQNVEYLLNALNAAQPEIDDNEAIVSIRFVVPTQAGPSDMATVSVSAGASVSPGDPMLLLAAHDAIVACARASNGENDSTCDSAETTQ